MSSFVQTSDEADEDLIRVELGSNGGGVFASQIVN